MQKNITLTVAVITLVIGVGIGYAIGGSKGLTSNDDKASGMHEMPDGSMMNDSMSMADMMVSMNAELKGRNGDDFDKAFLSEMIIHHEGAVDMARTALVQAKHKEIKDLANAIISAQNKEISEMRGWQKDWYTIDITIMVPEDMDAYDAAMNGYIFDGKTNPSQTLPFVKQTVAVASTTDVARASAQAAALYIDTQGGIAAGKLEHFMVVGSTAYVVLHMQVDGWAGVSVSLAKIKPLIEKTLLQFSGIKSVKFERAPVSAMSK